MYYLCDLCSVHANLTESKVNASHTPERTVFKRNEPEKRTKLKLLLNPAKARILLQQYKYQNAF